ncbi:MAG: hypothetical protein AAF483_13955 [Planctomycetota bacterium]
MSAIVNIAILVLIVQSSPAQNKDTAAPAPLKELAFAELIEQVKTLEVSNWLGIPNREVVLAEILRRNDPEAAGELRKILWLNENQLPLAKDKLESLRAKNTDNKVISQQRQLVDRLQNNLDLFTTLRRLEGKKDPLEITVVKADQGIVAFSREDTTLAVEIKNVDENQQAVFFKNGGDYRSGRLGRWKVRVWNAEGERLPDAKWESFMGGGIYSERLLEPGDSFKAKLNIKDYVQLEQPGIYRVEVLYHNAVTIADIEDHQELDKFILFRSKPFEIDVKKGPLITLEISEKEAASSREYVQQLNENLHLRILTEKYGRQHHDFIKPDSPAGKLLQMEWKAVPAMIETLRDKELSDRKRAWLLCLLYSITEERGLNPTRVDGAIVNWRLISESGAGSSSGGRIDRAKQQVLVDRWIDFSKEYLTIEPAP